MGHAEVSCSSSTARDKYEALAEVAREKLRQGMKDDDCPDLDAYPKG